MRKITFLFLFLLAFIGLNAQTNLLENPGFETWNGTKPDPWTLSSSGGTVTKGTDAAEGSSAIQIAATATFQLTQTVVAPAGGFDPSKKYKVSFKYKVTAGDGTDARIWSNWIMSEPGATTTTWWAMSLTDSLGLKGPGGNNQPSVPGDGTNGYLASNTGNWSTYTFSFNPPSGAKQFSFQVRTYNKATVIWEDFFFGEDVTNNVLSTKEQSLTVWTSQDKINFNASASEAIEVYNMMGQKVFNALAVDGQNEITVPLKGVAIVKVGNRTGKVIL